MKSKIAKVRALAAQGHNLNSIARALGCSRPALQKFVDRHGISIQTRLHRHITEEALAEVARLYREGVSTSEISQRINYPRSTVTRYVAEIAERAGKGKEWSGEDVALAIRLKTEGVPMKQIAKAVGRSVNAVLARFATLNLPAVEKKKPPVKCNKFRPPKGMADAYRVAIGTPWVQTLTARYEP